MQVSTIIKLCRRATKNNPKSVHIFDQGNSKTRYLKTTHGVYRVELEESGAFAEEVPYIGF